MKILEVLKYSAPLSPQSYNLYRMECRFVRTPHWPLMVQFPAEQGGHRSVLMLMDSFKMLDKQR